MAAQPPPYSPRDYYRAQRELARAQRDYWRSLRGPSIVTPIVLIAIGIVALMVELGKLSGPHIWDWYLRWWPILLVALGLISLAEWWFDRGRPYRARPAFGGVIVLLLVLLLIGYGNRGVRQWRLNPGDDVFFRLFGVEHDADRSISQELPAAALIQIQNSRGNLTVSPSSDNQLRVETHEVVYAGNDSDAERAFAVLMPRLTMSGRSVTLTAPGRGDGWADMTIEIPADATANIASGHGNVAVSDLGTPLNVNTGWGNVTVDRVKAPVYAKVGHGGLTARNIGGDVSVQGGWLRDLTVSGVAGRAFVDGNVFGNIRFERVASQVHLRSGRMEMDVASLPGELSSDAGSLSADDAAGPLRIATRSKDIRCSRISGNVSIENRNGEISLGWSGQPGATRIENHNGNIHLTLPPNANFNLDATARNGEIESEFGLPVDEAGHGHTSSGQVGSGGATIELVSDHGDIRISKGGEAAAAAPATTASAAAGRPEKGTRRLRAPQGPPPVVQNQ